MSAGDGGEVASTAAGPPAPLEWKFSQVFGERKTEFQSHELDYIKSLEIEEKINKIRWCQAANGAPFLLSTNDKTIKYWKVQEKPEESDPEISVKDFVDFEFQLEDPVTMLPSDELFSDEKLVPLHISTIRQLMATAPATSDLRSLDIPPLHRRNEISPTDPYLFSPCFCSVFLSCAFFLYFLVTKIQW